MELKEFRTKYKLSQSDVAIGVGVSLVSIQLWERSVTTPTEENNEKLEKYMQEVISKGE